MNNFLKRSYETWNWREWLQAITYKDKQNELVLKLFKTLEQSYKQLEKWWMEKDHMTKEWYEHAFISYEIAYNSLKDETWLVYYHNWDSNLWSINIDWKENESLDTKFLIQKRVLLVCEKLEILLEKDDMIWARKVIDDVFALIVRIWNKWITEDTFNYDHNYWYDKEWNMLQIDVGSFWEWNEYIIKEIEAKRMLNNQTSKWLKEKSAELYRYHIEKCEELYSFFQFTNS